MWMAEYELIAQLVTHVLDVELPFFRSNLGKKRNVKQYVSQLPCRYFFASSFINASHNS